MRTIEAALASLIALMLGAGVARIWDHRPRPGPVRVPARPRFARTFTASRFLKGNLHTHSTRSDGDTSPDEVARWYREHGYGFLALTDHNLLSSDVDLSGSVTPDFTLIAGEEVTMHGAGRPVHVNALCTKTVVPGGDFARAGDALAYAITAVTAQGGVALVNHPNFDWALTEADVVGAKGSALLEIASGHPYVHTAGDATHPSHEQLWDAALTAGRDVMGVGVDDMHHLVTDADPQAFPGKAWVSVFADGPATVCDALARGDLYASTGEELRSIRVDSASYIVVPASSEARVVFIGSGGRVLATRTSDANGVGYGLGGGEGYVRARIESATGTAWTPAVRVVSE